MSVVQKPTRSERCLQHLEASEELCRTSESLVIAIDDLQSTIWIEVALWEELVSDVSSLESRLHELVVRLTSPVAAP